MVKYAVIEAKAKQIKTIYLWVVEENLPARKFYQAIGFYPTGQTNTIGGTTKQEMRYELNL